MSITRYKGTRWRVRVHDPSLGRMVHIGIYDTKAQAREAEAAALTERELSDSMTLAAWRLRWIANMEEELRQFGESARRQESTIVVHAERTKGFAERYGHLRLNQVTVPMAREWSLAYRSHQQALNTMFADARLEGIELPDNPFSKLRIPRSKGRAGLPSDFLTREKIERLVSTAVEVHGEVAGTMFAALIATATETGLRRGELFALEWADVDLNAGNIQVERAWQERTQKIARPKNGVTGSVVLGPLSHEWLSKLSKQPMHPVLCFTSKTGKPLRGNHLHYLLDPVRHAAGIPELTTHWFRHYTATDLVERGVSYYDAAQQLRHQDGGELVRTTYSHRNTDAARERVRAALVEVSPKSLANQEGYRIGT